MFDIMLWVLAMILYANNQMAISIWLMAIYALNMSIKYGNKKVYQEVIDDYPIEDCVKPQKIKFMFKYINNFCSTGIPKEMYVSELIKCMGFGIYTFAGALSLCFNEKVSAVIGIFYFIISYGINLICIFIMIKKSFLSRYKILNIHNFKFLILGINGPYPKKIGRCQIVQEYRRKRKKIVTVRMLDTGELREKVLMQGEKRLGDNPIYSIYEICKVYYIV